MEIRQRLQQNEFLLGTWCVLPSAEVINVIAKAGVDFVMIDQEHGCADTTTVQKMIFAAQSENVNAIVRVGENSEICILKILDSGADGVLVPHIESSDDCKRALSYMLFPPDGIRGYSPYTRSGCYHHEKTYTERANKSLLKGIILEGKNGLESIDEILKEEMLDFVYVGTYDISASIGIPGQVRDPRVIKILEETVCKIRNKGKSAGCLFHSADELEYFKRIGVQLMHYKVDTSILFDSIRTIKEKK